MFFKKINHKDYSYIPRFYKPEEDKAERRKKKLKFRTDSTIRKKNRVPFLLLVFLGIIIYFLIKLNGA